MPSWADLIRDALIEIAAIDPIDPTPPELEALGLLRLNGIINQRNADALGSYNVTFADFTLVPNLAPHTIGPTGTFVVDQRPEEIIGATLLIGSGTNLVKIGPLAIRDDAWWLRQSVPNITSGIPTSLYYSPDWPDGALNFWPVPNVAYGIELEVRFVLSEVTDVTATFSMPPGYQRDLTLSLAEDLTGALGVPVPGLLPGKAAMARHTVQSNNNPPVRIQTRQSGVPGGRGRGDDWNWRSGAWN